MDETGEVDYRTFAEWFGTSKQAERAKLADMRTIRQDIVYTRWGALYVEVKTNIKRMEQVDNL